MPSKSYAYFEGIEGSCVQEGRQGSVEIVQMDHVVEIPVDPNNATATGTRRHGAVTLVGNIDKSTPLLMERVCTSKTIKKVKVEFWQIDENGVEQNYYNVEMTKVRVVKAETWFPNVDDRRTKQYKDMMTYDLRYDKITWTYTDGNLSFSDEWAKPNT